MKVLYKIFIIIVVLSLVITLGEACGLIEDESHPGASIDWGDGYYWNSQTNTVEETIW